MERKAIVDLFAKRLLINFENHCQKYEEENSVEHFITYLIDRELISGNAIKNYAIKESFSDFHKQELKKTATVHLLADKFNLTPRSIWNILKQK